MRHHGRKTWLWPPQSQICHIAGVYVPPGVMLTGHASPTSLQPTGPVCCAWRAEEVVEEAISKAPHALPQVHPSLGRKGNDISTRAEAEGIQWTTSRCNPCLYLPQGAWSCLNIKPAHPCGRAWQVSEADQSHSGAWNSTQVDSLVIFYFFFFCQGLLKKQREEPFLWYLGISLTHSGSEWPD